MPPLMGRLLQLILFVALVVIAVRAVRRMLAPPPREPPVAPPSFEATGRCARCDTFVPRRELDNAGLCFDCRTRKD